MTISQFSKRVMLTAATIRFYESKGFFSRKRGANNYRVFNETDIEEAKLITLGKSLNFTLKEIRDMTREFLSPKFDESKLKLKLENHVVRIDFQIKNLRRIRAMVVERMNHCSR